MNSIRKATIHQPDLMPWLGFYKKILKCDIWIVLDHVKNNTRNSGYWNRVKISIQDEAKWDTVPIKKISLNGSMRIPLTEFLIDQSNDKMIEKKMKSFHQSYGKCPYFRQALSLYEGYYSSSEPSLVTRNMNFIKLTLEYLGIEVDILYSSELGLDSHSNQMLVDILKKTGSDTYVHGDGADSYQEDQVYTNNNIKLIKNNFAHPIYNQYSSRKFLSGLSIIDAIANIGFEGTRSILEL